MLKGHCGIMSPKEQNAHSKNLILIIDANDLRKLGVNISRHLSWEQTTEDFYWQMINNPQIKSLAACKNLIVRFGLDGAIHYTNTDGKINASLYYDPNFGEDGYKEKYEGDIPDDCSLLVLPCSKNR